MSKRIIQSVVPLLLLALATAGLLSDKSFGTSAQRATVAGGPSRSAAIVATTAEILRETSKIRELEVVRPVKSGAQSRAEIERMLVKKLDEEMSPDDMHGTELSLRKFGLVPEGFEYRSFIIKLLTEQVAGYYDAKTREFYLADWLELEGQKPVMAHELTHALQDQHFNLQRFEKWPKGDSDAELATHALIEGDATLAMTLYMANNPMVALAFSRSLVAMSAASKQFNESPPALRDMLMFPYFQGREWATSLYKRGGWKMVSSAYARLPQSSEQILHPEKYFAYEAPVKIALPDLKEVLNEKNNLRTANRQTVGSRNHSAGIVQQESSAGKPTRPKRANKPKIKPRKPSHWRRVESDVNGEWGYYLILERFLNSPSESKRAAGGWAGDRYALYERPSSGQTLLAHVSQWDTENDAQEFFNAYIKRTALRYPDATLVPETPKSNTLGHWQTSEGGVVIELQGLRVVIVEGVPDGVDLKNLLQSLR